MLDHDTQATPSWRERVSSIEFRIWCVWGVTAVGSISGIFLEYALYNGSSESLLADAIQAALRSPLILFANFSAFLTVYGPWPLWIRCGIVSIAHFLLLQAGAYGIQMNHMWFGTEVQFLEGIGVIITVMLCAGAWCGLTLFESIGRSIRKIVLVRDLAGACVPLTKRWSIAELMSLIFLIAVLLAFLVRTESRPEDLEFWLILLYCLLSVHFLIPSWIWLRRSLHTTRPSRRWLCLFVLITVCFGIASAFFNGSISLLVTHLITLPLNLGLGYFLHRSGYRMIRRGLST